LYNIASQIGVIAKDFGAEIVSACEVIRILKVIRTISWVFKVERQSDTDKEILCARKREVQSTLLVYESYSPSNNRAKEDT